LQSTPGGVVSIVMVCDEPRASRTPAASPADRTTMRVS
jgi:hypothetical protein